MRWAAVKRGDSKTEGDCCLKTLFEIVCNSCHKNMSSFRQQYKEILKPG